ncbi:unnamed protein product [Macrosiphum euphorbiae]|uniref:MULE transposase domain-containing protein n=1 Tax=Macrosiphum euphorbiae TaxID=13131 RepID=A0AAV0VNZ7_9HEMI|nr:unnamed protein product [Macrosiphum euphorbiae]
MHAIIQNHSILMEFALMESKTETAYTLLLTKCKTLYPFLHPTSVMTDFEVALRAVCGNSERHSCWFHYVQVFTYLY